MGLSRFIMVNPMIVMSLRQIDAKLIPQNPWDLWHDKPQFHMPQNSHGLSEVNGLFFLQTSKPEIAVAVPSNQMLMVSTVSTVDFPSENLPIFYQRSSEILHFPSHFPSHPITGPACRQRWLKCRWPDPPPAVLSLPLMKNGTKHQEMLMCFANFMGHEIGMRMGCHGILIGYGISDVIKHGWETLELNRGYRGF